jgi:hypothetical protein
LDVSKIEDVHLTPKSFEQLVLKPEHRKLFESQVTVHTASRTTDRVNEAAVDYVQPELVPGKGKGLIILIHGGKLAMKFAL